MKYTFILLFILLVSMNGLSQTDPAVNHVITVSNDLGSTTSLYFGLDPLASDDFDPSLGEANLPPLPPATAWDTRLLLPEGTFSGVKSSFKDYRNASVFPFSGDVEHRIQYQVGSGTTVTVSWNFPAQISGVLQDIITGTLINVPMTGNGNYVVTQPAIFNKLKMMITYTNVITEVKNENYQPERFSLSQNYPNPFNPVTKISWQSPVSSHQTLKVYDILGNEVATLVDEYREAGSYEVEFQSTVGSRQLTSGIYFYQLQAGNKILTHKMTLLK